MLSAGTRFASYEITSLVGRGGMGEVYRARDTRLERDVAVKVLPEAFSRDPERLARFEREARLLASLNHPNIAAVYDFEETAATRFLVLELVEGDTLAQRLKSGALPMEEALEIARDVAQALEAAHASGIIHRDLKPGNIKVTPDGRVKVLDFGLAKALGESDGEPSRTDSVDSPTITADFTRHGVVLGTAPYMSPEQLRGRSLDKRTDIWSFGCVLYECLSGRRPFSGESSSDVIAHILQGVPDFSALPPNTPPGVRSLLARCLEKDRRRRLRDAGDAVLELDEAISTRAWSTAALAVAAQVPPFERRNRQRLTAALAVLFAGALLGAVGMYLWSRASSAGLSPAAAGAVSRLSLVLPAPIEAESWRLSPDGSMVAWIARPGGAGAAESQAEMIFARGIGEYETRVLAGTEFAGDLEFSPDGRWIAFRARHRDASRQRLGKVAADSSSPVMILTDWKDGWDNFLWLESGEILVTLSGDPAYVRVPSAGGVPTPPQKIEAAGFSGLFNPHALLPGRSAALLNCYSWGPQGYQQGTAVLDVASGRAEIVLESGSNALYSTTGHLLFTRGATLMAVPFDARRLKCTGDPVAVASDVRTRNSWDDGWFGLAANGTLVHAAGGQIGRRRQVVTVDREGRVEPWSDERKTFEPCLRVSPDGRRLAVVCSNLAGNYEIWTAQRDQPRFRRFAAVEEADCVSQVWSPDGERLAYSRFGRKPEDGVYVHSAEGSTEAVRVYGDVLEPRPMAWSADGNRLLIWRKKDGQGDAVLLKIGPDQQAEPVEETLSLSPRIRDYAVFSPDGRHLAYSSDDSGQWENYVCPLDKDGAPGTSVPVSRGAADWALWAPEGDALYWEQGRQHVMEVTLTWQPEFEASEPRLVLDLNKVRCATGEQDFIGFDVLPGGRFIIVQKGEDEREITALNVVLNWFAELTVRAPAGTGSE